ncbi:MAG TPA: hypothetical protein VFQ53_16590 [Kofleriaceae bacterium]|nr:hypothetical protein [Kofleriaceae bacterium]
MTVDELGRVLEAIPAHAVASASDGVDAAAVDAAAVEGSAGYLASDAALDSIEADPYWPKWDSPWWHMVLLFELGEARRIPSAIVDAMVRRLDAMPLHSFPIRPEDSPPGIDPDRDSSCHCALGCMHQVLTACGVDVAAALPWVEPWFARYQMADGGLNCDASAYLVEDECASSMVGTIAAFEAMSARGATPFVDRAAQFLIERELMRGSSSRHNAEERAAAPAWLEPCFPRFYFYDVLRGLHALVQWAVRFERVLPVDAVAGVVAHLARRYPDGVVRIRRRAFANKRTLARVDGAWVRQPATIGPGLEAVSEPGRVSPILTTQWAAARRGLRELIDAGRLRPA